MTEYGITEESISDAIHTGRGHLETWVESQGYNITEIEETIIVYGAMLSGNDTLAIAGNETMVSSSSNDTVVEDTGYMSYVTAYLPEGVVAAIPDIGMDEIREYYNSVTELIDFEAVGNIAGSIGGFLFGTGSGVLGMFSSIISSLLGAVDLLLQFIVFVGALFYFMESDDSVISMAVKIVPVSA
eukprot:CAMPEP_0117012690 /NCGR_PEP_ID=MMETSP0472-20121206/10626_1 /TAXON_ID=693140 ORGANISM="Tiarina fusus, Strain LIS" /NCGR_SAMPLE_ID=MMETSP0472 /ASSEMBLY_ACC=CAM_ASM_000603 /LENGTH=184 /DNA_ID=CAMNT_0004715823 /DNA_START=702 /DNA_END=1252 /DNA_ORIENTATION=-